MPNKHVPIGRPAPYSFAWQPNDNAPNEFRFASGNDHLSEPIKSQRQHKFERKEATKKEARPGAEDGTGVGPAMTSR